MIFFQNTYIRWGKRATALGLAVALFLTPFSLDLTPKKAYALDGGAGWTLVTKEYTLDTIAWMAMNAIIDELAADVVDWINSGFEGSPAFMQDLDGRLLGIANEQAGNFIYGTELGFLCSPFQLEVQMSLLLEMEAKQKFDVQCTLTDVVDNVEGFMGGDFLAGGWNGWYQMTQQPRNNPYGAFVLGYEEMSARITNARGEEIKLIELGKGFLTLQECQEFAVPNPNGAGERTETHCKDTTPGTVIEDRLNSALGLGEKRMAIADEMNEVIGALVSRLAKDALSGLSGINTSGIRNTEGGTRGYVHEGDPQPESETAEVSIVTTCNDAGTTCNSDGTVSLVIGEDDRVPTEVCGFAGDVNNCRPVRDVARDPSNNSSGQTSTGGGGDTPDSTQEALDDEFNDSGLPGDPIEEGPFGEPNPNPTPGLPNPGEGGSPSPF